MGFKLLLIPVLLIIATIGLTLAVEFPIVYLSGVTRNKIYIVSVNAVTNVALNMGIVILYALSFAAGYGVYRYGIPLWTIVSELCLIPVAEAVLYIKISSESKKKIWFVTYVANLCSYLIGVSVFWIIFRNRFEEVGLSFVRLLLGGP